MRAAIALVIAAILVGLMFANGGRYENSAGTVENIRAADLAFDDEVQHDYPCDFLELPGDCRKDQ